jgi:hypothetical protein
MLIQFRELAINPTAANRCFLPYRSSLGVRRSWTASAKSGRQATRKECCGKNDLDRANPRERVEVGHLLGAVMRAKKDAKNERPSVLDVVALLADLPAQRLARGQVGTVVEQLNNKTLLVEFSDNQGGACAIAPCPRAELRIQHYIPEAA